MFYHKMYLCCSSCCNHQTNQRTPKASTMIPILSTKDIEFVRDEVLRAGLEAEFKRLPDDYLYPTYGYFIVIESIEELQKPIKLQNSAISQIPEPLSDYIEMIEEFDGYSQIVCILEADFGVSLFVSEKLATKAELETLFEI